jgi:hypothetical protein
LKTGSFGIYNFLHDKEATLSACEDLKIKDWRAIEKNGAISKNKLSSLQTLLHYMGQELSPWMPQTQFQVQGVSRRHGLQKFWKPMPAF